VKKIYLAKYAQSKFGVLGNITLEQMMLDAGRQDLDGVDRSRVDHIAVAGLLAPLLNDQSLIAGLVAMDPVYTNKSIKGVANACDSGGLAVLDCAAQVMAGLAHVGLAIGVEKMHPLEGKLDSKKVGLALGTAAHQSDLFPPFTFPHAFAVIMDRYLKTYGISEQEFAIISPIFYDNASHNPLAHMHVTKKPVTAQAVMESYRLFQDPPMPLKLFECSQISDGWARILVCDEEGLNQLGIDKSQATVLAGFAQATDSLSIDARGENLLKPVGAKKAFGAAMQMAGAKSSEISVQEVHDCFSVMAPISVETTGFAEPGQGATVLQRRPRQSRRPLPDQHLGWAHRQGASHQRHRYRHDRLDPQPARAQGAGATAGRKREARDHPQHRWPHLQHRCDRAEDPPEPAQVGSCLP